MKEIGFKLNYFNFKEFDSKYLITNDIGKFVIIEKNDFEKLVSRNNSLNEETKKTLNERFFIYNDREDFIDKSSKELRLKKNYLIQGTQLHIFVLTTYCNFSCIYCQASATNRKNKGNKFMTKEVAEKAVDIALQSPSTDISIEFQGGEPLANFEILKYVVQYANSRKEEANKNISYSVISNLTLLNEEMIRFFKENNVSVSTSIDGPEYLQNINRKCASGNSYRKTYEKIQLLKKEYNNSNYVQAIQTTSKFSLKYAREIVDEYINLGINTIFIRPLTPMGYAVNNWFNIGYTADEFLKFYKESLDYIIQRYISGQNIVEGHALMFLKNILTDNPMNYMELRSPCGGAIGQLAYNYDGNIYTCDEGRMLAEMGDESFKLGNVFENTLVDLIKNPVCKSLAISSCLEIIPGCNECVYSPYCGVCPVCNYKQYNDLFAPNPNSYRCKIYKGILDILFEKIINDKDALKVFNEWVQ